MLLENIRVRWHNWRNRKVAKAYRALSQAMRDDPDFAHSWQCNIAMPIFDQTKLSHEEANVIADRLMKHLFDVSSS